jgi:hypothetical protein
MELLINGLITKIKGIFIKEVKDEKEKKMIEGYLLKTDSTNKQSMLLVKENEKCWKTKWFNDDEYTYTPPSAPISSVFK